MRCLRPEIRASHASTQSEGQTQGRTGWPPPPLCYQLGVWRLGDLRDTTQGLSSSSRTWEAEDHRAHPGTPKTPGHLHIFGKLGAIPEPSMPSILKCIISFNPHKSP